MAQHKLSQKEVREVQMKIMDDIHDFCIKNNIRYSLAAGTLLGAIRHGGYIPWDDDIDIMMPRPDYIKFINTYKSHDNYFLANQYTDPLYISAFSKIYDTTTETESGNLIDNKHLFVDIFPVDGMPDEKDIDDYLAYARPLIENLRKSGKYYLIAKGFRKKIILWIKYLIKRISIPSTKQIYAVLDKYLARYNFEDSSHAGMPVDSCMKDAWMPKDIFDNYHTIAFENRQYLGIVEAKRYLENTYGDWEKLPPIEQRVGLHFTNVYKKD